jgi:NADPH:quinone reductase-like Zn-dependent oxidoreductase
MVWQPFLLQAIHAVFPIFHKNFVQMLRKCWKIIPRAGSVHNLKLVEEHLRDPGPGEVQIAVRAIGFNFADIFAIFGLYGATPEGSFVPGLEYAGMVVKTGEGVKSVKEGQNIMGVTRFGGYASHLNVDARYVSPLPEGWSMTEGAAYLVQVLTAYYGLINLGNIQKGSTVLIHSAAGGVGIWANRIAKTFDAYTIGCVGNTAKLDLLRKEGYDKAFVRGDNFRRDLRDVLDGKDLHIVMECIGGKILLASYLAMAPEGRMIVYGSARYAQPGSRPNYLKLLWQYWQRVLLDPQKMIEQNKAVLGFNLIYLYENVALMHQILSELERMNVGKPFVGHVFEFEKLKDALALFRSGMTTGKVVVSI